MTKETNDYNDVVLAGPGAGMSFEAAMLQHQILCGSTRDGMSAVVSVAQDQNRHTPDARSALAGKGQTSNLLSGLIRRL